MENKKMVPVMGLGLGLLFVLLVVFRDGWFALQEAWRYTYGMGYGGLWLRMAVHALTILSAAVVGLRHWRKRRALKSAGESEAVPAETEKEAPPKRKTRFGPVGTAVLCLFILTITGFSPPWPTLWQGR